MYFPDVSFRLGILFWLLILLFDQLQIAIFLAHLHLLLHHLPGVEYVILAGAAVDFAMRDLNFLKERIDVLEHISGLLLIHELL